MVRGNEKAWSSEAALDVLSTDGYTEREVLGALDLLAGFYADLDEEIIEPIRLEMYHGRTAGIRLRAVSSLAAIATPLALTALEESRATIDPLLRFRSDLILRSREYRKAVKRAADPSGRAFKAEKTMEKETERLLMRSGKLIEKTVRDEIKLDSLAAHPVPVATITEGGPGYRIDFVPKTNGAATSRVWMGIRSVSFGIGPRDPFQTLTWRNRFARTSQLLLARAAVEDVTKGAKEKFDRRSGDSVAILGPKPSGEQVATASGLSDFKDLPFEWEMIEYGPWV